MKRHEPWYESDNPDRLATHGIPRVWLWVLATVAVVALAGAAVWGLRVATANVRGAGDAYQQQQSAQNRVRAQEAFRSRYEDIKATDSVLDAYADWVRQSPDDRTARDSYVGTIAYCKQAVAEYNAEAQKYSSRDFRDADLPERIDPNDPATDCKPQE